MDAITTIQAEVLRTLAHPRRLEILHVIADRPGSVSGIATELSASPPNLSEHLAVLKAAGLVEAERHGREIRYRLADPELTVACGVMRRVLERRFSRLVDVPTPARLPTVFQPTA